MDPTWVAALLALGSAAAWGTGDFSGGLASRNAKPVSIALVSNPIGLVFLMSVAVLRGAAEPSLHDALLGLAGGVCGGLGLVVFYGALASGRMGVVAPITAVVTNVMSMLFGAITEGAPGTLQLVGFALAIAGVWIISRPDSSSSQGLTWRDLQPAVLAGVGFGAFFILTGQFSSSDVSWPLVIARVGTIMVVTLLAWQSRTTPSFRALPLAVVAGIMDSVGNFCFALATQTGRLDVSAALSSLYPVTTVLLAVLVLRERVTKTQAVGAVLALAAIPLIAL
jgi:uncharacterized membrane protein